VDRVAEQRDRAGRPALTGLDYPDGQQRAVVRVGLLDQRAQLRVANLPSWTARRPGRSGPPVSRSAAGSVAQRT